MTSATDVGLGLAMLQAASIALSDAKPSVSSSTPSSFQSTQQQKQDKKYQQKEPHLKPSCTAVSALLNPAPADMAAALPQGFVLGKDGKVKKKRGRKPTPGLTDEDRRQARLLKNRRTAETSRRRKLALMNRLTAERDQAKLVVEKLKKHTECLTQRLAKALGRSVEELVEEQPDVVFRDFDGITHSDVSAATTAANSESDASVKKS